MSGKITLLLGIFACLISFLPETLAEDQATISPLTVQDGKIPGWRASQSVKAVTTDLPQGVAHGVEITVAGDSGNDGEIVQKLSTEGMNGLYRLSVWAKSTKGRTAYLQVKRYKGKKELNRTNSSHAGNQWGKISLLVDVTGADRIGIIARWHHKKHTKGATVQFANVSMEPINGVIAFVGDSTVQDYPLYHSRRGWGQMLPAKLSDEYMCVNFAKGGRSTKTFREEGHWKKVLAAKPKWVFIQFGHNDSHEPGRPESTDAKTDFIDYLRAYVKEATAIGAKVVLVSPPHRRVFKSSGKLSMRLAPYAKSMQLVAKELNVPFIDLFGQTEALYTRLGEDGALPHFSSVKDRSHYSEKGATALATMVATSLKQNSSTSILVK